MRRALGWFAVAAALALLALCAWLSLRGRAWAEGALLAALEARGVESPRLRVESLLPWHARLRGIELGRDAELRIGDLELGYSPLDLARGRLGSLRATKVELRLSAGPEGLSLGSLDAALAGSADAAGSREAGRVAPGALALPIGHATLEALRVSAATPAGRLTLRGRLDYQASGARVRGSLALPEALLPALGPLELEARATPADAAWDIDLSAHDADQRVSLQANGRYLPAAGTGNAEVQLAPVRFAPDALQPADLFPGLAGWIGAARGELSARAALQLTAGRVSGGLDLALRDGSFALPVARFARVNGAVHLDGPDPIAVPRGQLLSIGVLDFGLELSNGLVRYGVLPDATIQIESADWEFAGGHVHTAGLVDPGSQKQSLVLDVRGLELADLLRLVPFEGLSGEGRVSGRLPLVRRGEVLEIRSGVLRGDPDGGWIRYAPGHGASAGGALGHGVDVTLSVLDNLRWEELELQMDGDTQQELTLSLHVAGRNPGYQGARPVELNLSVEGRLADLLRRGSQTYRLPEAIERRIAEIAGRAEADTLDPHRKAR